MFQEVAKTYVFKVVFFTNLFVIYFILNVVASFSILYSLLWRFECKKKSSLQTKCIIIISLVLLVSMSVLFLRF